MGYLGVGKSEVLVVVVGVGVFVPAEGLALGGKREGLGGGGVDVVLGIFLSWEGLSYGV